MRRKVKLLNNVLVLGTKLDQFLLESELLRHLNESSTQQTQQSEDQPHFERAQSVPQTFNNRTRDSQEDNNEMLHRSISSVMPQHVPKNSQNKQMDDTIEEGLRRRQLLLEAAERRMQEASVDHQPGNFLFHCSFSSPLSFFRQPAQVT